MISDIDDDDDDLVEAGDGATGGAPTVPLRAKPPEAERLNRNAALIAAAVLGMAALVAVVFLAPARGGGSRGGAQSAARPAAPAAAPSFMDRPILGALVTAPRRPPIGDTGGEVARATLASSNALVSAGGAEDSPAGAQRVERSDSVDDYRQALVSDAITARAGEQRVAPADVVAGTRPSVLLGSGAPPTPGSGAIRVVAVSAGASRGGYVLAAGSVVPVVLLTTITSDIAGDCVAQLSRDVYDSPTESVMLIPRGTKLVGHLASGVVHGQRRLALAWVRIDLPNGRVIDLPSQPGTDAGGGAGVPADVDNHLFRTFGAAGVTAAIGAGMQLSQPSGSGAVYVAPSVGQILAGSLGQELGTVGLEVVRRELDEPPTLTVAAGTEFNLLLTVDLVFGDAYPGGDVGHDRAR